MNTIADDAIFTEKSDATFTATEKNESKASILLHDQHVLDLEISTSSSVILRKSIFYLTPRATKLSNT